MVITFFKAAVTAFLCVFFTMHLYAQDLKFAEGMPSPEQVLSKIKGRNLSDTYARQAGAFLQLKDLTEMMVDGSPREYASVNELVLSYSEQVNILSEKYLVIKGNKKNSWDRAVKIYFGSGLLEEEIFKNLLSEHTTALLREKSNKNDKALQWSKRLKFIMQKSPGVYLIVLAIISFFFSHRLADSISRKRFDRTNPYGVEEFPDYETSRAIRIKEHLKGQAAGYLLLASWIFLFVGIFWLVAM